MTLAHKQNRFDPCFPLFPLLGCLAHEHIHKVFHFYFDEILTLMTFQKIQQISVEETTVRLDKQR